MDKIIYYITKPLILAIVYLCILVANTWTLSKFITFEMGLFMVDCTIMFISTLFFPPNHKSKSQTKWYQMTSWCLDKIESTTNYLGNLIETPILSLQSKTRKNARTQRRKSSQLSYVSTTRHVATSITVFAAVTALTTGHTSLYDNSCVFDSDTKAIGVDNRASGCISDDINDFVGPLRTCNRAIKGFGGSRTLGVQIGTLKWAWLDDSGLNHTFHIPNAYYVPQGKIKLLSPQHLAQALRDTKPNEGTVSITDSCRVILQWAQRKYKMTVPLGKNDNVATFHLAPGIKQFTAFCAEIKNDDHNPIIADPAYISDDDDSIGGDNNNDDDIPISEGGNGIQSHKSHNKYGLSHRQRENTEANTPVPVPTDFDLDGPMPTNQEDSMNVVDDEEDCQPTNIAAELLRYHQRYNHLSFAKLQEMAKQGEIPKQMAKCPIPACSACMFAKATKKRWRDKSSNNNKEATKPTKPGQVVSVDQLTLPTPGFIAQLTGSCLGYIYLQKTTLAEETIEAKQAFERYAAERGITIQAYHANNRVFWASKWQEACQVNKQRLTFAAVNAHHQNGIAERRICELQGMAPRT